ncbi:hypothetical protein BKA04_001416 [Cryobacterium mesophilum]|uniref:YtxH domain-containing protein n=2 Tax=Terrimesophilobacter mesophilus TaxID=433647 RepID=A0A4R8VCV6_9MICO|nr:hypothetical protein [Terrimesophilobacter mesophilus]MBB5633193.1 hypothetical protein [Terrimesophilobacter mesophilus]TFB79942.1 YtxH domain-containing protein [Terrimesophilobacter mesophilus]
MRGKLVLLVGIGIGYVLGARAGRERYNEIKRSVSRFWNDPRVQHQVQNVEEFAKDKAPDVVDFLGETAKKVVTRSSSGSSKGSTAKARSANGKSSSTTRSSSTSAKK